MSAGLLQSRISLISRKDIRWEGILVQVDRENASVTLRDVKSWGTEGRLEGDQQIPPSDHLHACVNFRGEDIKDLHVHETAEPPAPPPPAPPVETPPAPPTAPPPTAAATRVAPDAAAGQGRARAAEDGDSGVEDAGGSSTMRDQGLKPGRYQPPHKNPNWKPPPTVQRGPPGPGSGAGSGTGALPGQGNHLLNRRTRGAGGAPVDEEGEFDFQAGLAKFDKEKEMALLAGGVSVASIHDTIDNSGAPHMNGGGTATNGDANGSTNGGDDGGGASAGPNADGGGGGGGAEGSAAAAAVAAAAASRAGAAGEPRSAADGGGEIWVEPPVVVKKYNKVRGRPSSTRSRAMLWTGGVACTVAAAGRGRATRRPSGRPAWLWWRAAGATAAGAAGDTAATRRGAAGEDTTTARAVTTATADSTPTAAAVVAAVAAVAAAGGGGTGRKRAATGVVRRCMVSPTHTCRREEEHSMTAPQRSLVSDASCASCRLYPQKIENARIVTPLERLHGGIVTRIFLPYTVWSWRLSVGDQQLGAWGTVCRDGGLVCRLPLRTMGSRARRARVARMGNFCSGP